MCLPSYKLDQFVPEVWNRVKILLLSPDPVIRYFIHRQDISFPFSLAH